MKILEIIAQTLQTHRAHPTIVFNALIDLENAQGLQALEDLEERLQRLVQSYDRTDLQGRLAYTWLQVTRAYLEEYGQLIPVQISKPNFDQQVIALLQLKAS